jgi:hypothetical protein
MDTLEQFTALMRYFEKDPATLRQHGEIGKAMLEQIEQACLLRDAEALSDGIDGFLSILMDANKMRGFTPVESQKAAERFNSVRQSARSVLDKMPK